jgi:hypothetical protein
MIQSRVGWLPSNNRLQPTVLHVAAEPERYTFWESAC